jgi:hypothetical protein
MSSRLSYIIFGVTVATAVANSSASLCSAGSYDGNHVETLGGTNPLTCDQILDVKKNDATFTAGFDRTKSYTCGISQNDIALKTVIDTFKCCGSSGKSTCDKDYSNVCGKSASFQKDANAVGAIVNSVQLTCQQTMMALKDPKVSLNGATFGKDVTDFKCNTNGTMANVLDGVISVTKCCGDGNHSKCFFDGKVYSTMKVSIYSLYININLYSDK